MPILEKIIVQNWRNISLEELDFSSNMNCICGNNGQGKTNLLDAIYYLSMTKSAFNTTDKFNFQIGCKEFALSGTYLMESGLKTKFSIKVGAEKKVLKEGKAYSKISEHIGVLPIVMVSPSDYVLVSDGGEERRRFCSSVLSQTNPKHLSALQNYNKALSQRNALLKKDNIADELLESLDYTMEHYAQEIFTDRSDFITKLTPKVQKYYDIISSSKEKVNIVYQSDLQKGKLSELLIKNRQRDRVLQHTTSGIHRDELIFLMNDEHIRRIGSQGQQKCFLVALKFAQYELMKELYGFAPILLLDDLFDKLDLQRTEKLLQMVCGEEFGQIFISDTNRDRLESIIAKYTAQSHFFEIENGQALLKI